MGLRQRHGPGRRRPARRARSHGRRDGERGARGGPRSTRRSSSLRRSSPRAVRATSSPSTARASRSASSRHSTWSASSPRAISRNGGTRATNAVDTLLGVTAAPVVFRTWGRWWRVFSGLWPARRLLTTLTVRASPQATCGSGRMRRPLRRGSMAAEGAMHMPAKITPGHSGDRIEIASIGGAPARRGRIVEVLGEPHHEHYLVRWEDGASPSTTRRTGPSSSRRPTRPTRLSHTAAPQQPRLGGRQQAGIVGADVACPRAKGPADGAGPFIPKLLVSPASCLRRRRRSLGCYFFSPSERLSDLPASWTTLSRKSVVLGRSRDSPMPSQPPACAESLLGQSPSSLWEW